MLSEEQVRALLKRAEDVSDKARRVSALHIQRVVPERQQLTILRVQEVLNACVATIPVCGHILEEDKVEERPQGLISVPMYYDQAEVFLDALLGGTQDSERKIIVPRNTNGSH